jgi:putative ABC transport system substrate-binding protein
MWLTPSTYIYILCAGDRDPVVACWGTWAQSARTPARGTAVRSLFGVKLREEASIIRFTTERAKAATATIPIVFTLGGDPVETGLVASLARPGGNLTGTTIMAVEMGPKRLDLIRQLVPNATAIAMLVNPKFPTALAEARGVQDAARPLGIQVSILNATNESEIETAFTNLIQQKASALMVGTDPLLLGQRDQIAGLAARHATPTMYFLREFVQAGGLLSYGPDIRRGYRQAGVYAGYILGGANPAELPVLLPTSFLLSVNLKTTKALGLTLRATLLALAEEVIEQFLLLHCAKSG